MIQYEYTNTEEVIKMAKTETLHMRIDADLKSNAEYLLNQLGMSTTEAVSIFFKTGYFKQRTSL